MSLVAQWDIRLESYSDTANVTSLTEQVTGAVDLDSTSASYPDYVESSDSMNFTPNESIANTVDFAASAIDTAITGSDFTIAILLNMSSAVGGYGFSIGSSDSGAYLVACEPTNTDVGNRVRFLVNDNSSSADFYLATDVADSTDHVIFLWLDSGSSEYGIAIDSGSESTTASSAADVSGVNFTKIGLGARFRSSVNGYWTGNIKEVRIYDSDESGSRTAITAAMKAGPVVGGLSIPIAMHHFMQMRGN